ncbi:MAG: protein kinase, partial [Bradymonadaceae bacterium]
EYYIAMEYVPGRDLRDLLKRVRREDEQQMPVDLALHIAAEVCEGLGYAHRQTDETGQPLNIVHRDISPSNILISTEGEVKIIDFGIARAAGRRARTLSGQIEGKCRYMSPEQATGQDIDHRSDIFSTGVVLYEMLTGVSPFEGESDLESLELVRQCEFDPPSTLNADIDEELDEIVDRALARDREERYQTIDDFHDELVQHLYTRGRAVTNRDLADFLEEKFPEGPEREEFRESADAPPPDEDLGLQEALDFEAERLGERSPEETSSRESTPTDPASETVDPVGTTDAFEPEEIEGVDVAEPGSDTGRDRAPPSSSRVPVDRPNSSMVRWLAAVGVAVVAAMAAWYAVRGGGDSAELRVTSTPSGATIAVDGTVVAGERTPATIDVEPGVHRVRVERGDGESKEFRIDLESGEVDRLSAEFGGSSPAEAPDEAKTFRVRTRPSGARLSVNQRRVGTAPREVRVSPGETKLVEATGEGCRPAQMPVFYGRSETDVVIRLDCPDAGTVDAGGGATDAAQRQRPRRRTVAFTSEPTGATVVIDGEQNGKTPTEATFAVGRRLEVRFDKKGFRSKTFHVEVGRVGGDVHRQLKPVPKGCLNFFAVRPQYNRIAIDGKWLDGRRQKLKGYELPVGKHRIRVQNPEAGKDETFTFEIQEREECTSLTVWDPTDD